MHPRLQLLSSLADGHWHSGQALGEATGVSRAAINKHVAALQDRGMDIEAQRGRGYRWSSPVELLDAGLIRAGLPSGVLDQIARLEVMDETDSTNAEILRWRSRGLNRCEVCVAEYQHAGRGRRRRGWLSSFAAGINLSLAWHFDPAPDSLNGLGLAAGVAVLRALQSMGVADAGLKWPNDILCEGRKLGGILIEMAGESGGPCHVVVGIGLNVRLPLSGRLPDQPWTDLHRMGHGSVSRNVLTSGLVESVIDMLQDYSRHGFAGVRHAWQAGDCILGREVTVHLPDRDIRGVAAGVAGDGALMLDTGTGIRHFHAGEVTLRCME